LSDFLRQHHWRYDEIGLAVGVGGFGTLLMQTPAHLANAPTMPLVALYLKHLGGGDEKIAWVVIVAQAVMVPVALLAGKYCAKLARKPVFAVAFIVLPIRILLYAITKNPTALLTIQALDGIGAGIYGVVIALICSDLTRGKPGFNTLMGVAATALAVGGVLGPLLQGVVTQHLGFPITFLTFAGIATLAAFNFLLRMPETWRPEDQGGESKAA
jgi:MFS family permease